MRVLLIGNLPQDEQISMLAFQEMLARTLPRLGCEVRLVTPRPIALLLPWPVAVRKWIGYIDKFVLFRMAVSRHLRWADVAHVTDHSNAMYVPWLRSKPNVVTCHDVIAIQAAMGLVPGWNVSRTGRLFQRLISKGLGRADVVVCVSDLTRRDLLQLGLAQEPKVITVPNGLNADFSPLEREQAQRLIARLGLAEHDEYLLHVGSDLARKNRMAVLKSYIELIRQRSSSDAQAVVQKLVLVGPRLSQEMAALAASEHVADRIVTVEKISHEELQALYSRASALVFPSLQEGFGWPVIEAQACGCPVFASNLAPMNEIGSGAAEYVDPHDPVAMASSIARSVPRREAMRRDGLANAAHYSAPQMASNYVAAYRRVIDARSPR